MRPVLDPRLFPGLPKFLWFDDGGTGGDASGVGGVAAGPGSGAPAGTSTTSADAAAAGIGGVGSAGQADAVGGSSDAASAFGGGGGQTSVTAAPGGTANTGVTDAAAQGMAFGGGSGGSTARGGAATGGGAAGGGGPGAATGGGGTGGPGAATGGGGGTAAGGSGFSASVRSALQALLGPSAPSSNYSGFFLGKPGASGPGLGVDIGGGTTTVSQSPRAAPKSTNQLTSPLAEPGPNLATLAQQLLGSQAAQAARSSISADTGDEFGPTNTTKGSGSSTATSANTNAAPNFGGQGFGSGSPAAPSLSIGPGGIGSDAVAGGSSPNAPPGTPSLSIGPGGIGADVNAGQGVSTYGDMSDARGFGGTKGVGDPGAVGSAAVGTPAPGVALGGGPGNASDSPTGTPAAPSLSIGPGGIGADVNAGQGVSTYGDMSDARGFGGTKGVGDPGAAPGNASDSPTGTPAPSPGAVTGTPLAQVVTSLINGNAGPALAQLAATIFGAPPGYGVPGTNNFGNMTYQQLQKFMGVDPSSVLAPSIGPQGPPGSPSSSTQSAQFGI
jgi:hypothetical protein